MKAKKLIELLNTLDHSGELECCIDNIDIRKIETDRYLGNLFNIQIKLEYRHTL